jgi:hypothetical protein
VNVPNKTFSSSFVNLIFYKCRLSCSYFGVFIPILILFRQLSLMFVLVFLFRRVVFLNCLIFWKLIFMNCSLCLSGQVIVKHRKVSDIRTCHDSKIVSNSDNSISIKLMYNIYFKTKIGVYGIVGTKSNLWVGRGSRAHRNHCCLEIEPK